MNICKCCVSIYVYTHMHINKHALYTCLHREQMYLHRHIKTRFPCVTLHKKLFTLPSLPPPLLTELCITREACQNIRCERPISP